MKSEADLNQEAEIILDHWHAGDLGGPRAFFLFGALWALVWLRGEVSQPPHWFAGGVANSDARKDPEAA